MKHKDVSSLLRTHLQHLHLWGLFSSKSQRNERQRDIWRKRKPANKKGGYGHTHQQTLQTSRLWLQFCGRSDQEPKDCYACQQPRGWKAHPLKDLQDPHTLHPVAKLEHLHIPKVAPEASPQSSPNAPWWVWFSISYTRSAELWKSQLSLMTTCMWVHIDLEEEGIRILLLTKESEKNYRQHTWVPNPEHDCFRIQLPLNFANVRKKPADWIECLINLLLSKCLLQWIHHIHFAILRNFFYLGACLGRRFVFKASALKTMPLAAAGSLVRAAALLPSSSLPPSSHFVRACWGAPQETTASHLLSVAGIMEIARIASWSGALACNDDITPSTSSSSPTHALESCWWSRASPAIDNVSGILCSGNFCNSLRWWWCFCKHCTHTL